jgi:hypothetical protein
LTTQACRATEGGTILRSTTRPGSRFGWTRLTRRTAAAALAAATLTTWVVVAAARPPAAATDGRAFRATTAARLDPPVTPPLAPPRSEAPAPFDRDVTPRECAACRLADATTGRIAVENLHVRVQALDDGVAVRATATDPEERELLWRAMVARGELIESLRSGDTHDLCDACSLRSELLASLRISVRRIADGVELVYTSTSPGVVREIHAAGRATQPFVTRF